MRRKSAGQLQYSPSDLTRYVASPFASWLTRFQLEHRALEIPKDEPSEEMAILQELGLVHEAAFLETLQADNKSVYVLTTEKRDPNALAEETIEAMQAGHDVIFQAYLRSGSFQGYADFLYKVPGTSNLGTHYYEPWDTKLALSVKPYFIVQLCCYAELLADVQGVRPEHVGVILGNGEMERKRTADFYFAYLAIKQAFLDQMNGDFSSLHKRPVPDSSKEHAPYASYAEQLLLECDHLSQVAGMTKGQIAKLEKVGIVTMAGLAETSAERVPGLQEEIYARLRGQALLQFQSRGRERPLYNILPAPEGKAEHGLGRLLQPSPGDLWSIEILRIENSLRALFKKASLFY